MKWILKLLASLCHLRTLFLCASVLCLFAPLSIAWFEVPNTWLFRLGVQLSGKPAPANHIVNVTVPQRELDRLVNDAPGALGIGELLQGLRGVYTRAVVVLLDDVPRPENYAVEMVSRNLLSQDSIKEVLASQGALSELQALSVRQQTFQSGLEDGALLAGIAHSVHASGKTHFVRESQRVKADSMVSDGSWPSWLNPDQGPFNQGMLDLAHFRFESNVQGFAFFDAPNIAYPLLWRVNEAVFPDVVMEALKKSRGAKTVAYQPGSVQLDQAMLPLSAGAVIYPLYSVASGKIAPVENIALSDLLSTRDYGRFHNKTVIIGVKDSAQLQNVSSALYSLDVSAYYVTPPWFVWAEKSMILVLLLYVLLLLPRVKIRTGFIATGVVWMTLLVAQLVWQVAQQHWLPVAFLLCYLLLGHGLFLLSRQLAQWFGEWELVVVEKGAAVPQPKINRTRQEPRLPGGSKTESRLGFLDRTMAITRRPGKLRFGRYEVDRELGRGAMGVVYLGHDPSIDRKVAIKTLNFAQFAPEELNEVKERFLREARAVGKFDPHPNIIGIYDTGEDNERAYIAMEYVEGKPLNAHIQKNTLIKNYDELYWIIESVADALNYAHAKGVIHRDIKPANILYDEKNGKVKVSDFGIARLLDSSATRTGEIIGSPLYMSPEQVKGESLTGKTDIYSLGVTFYQLLTGDLPFKGDTIPAITHQIVQGKYIPVNELNARLPASAPKIIAKAMHKDPDRRYASAADMMEDIMKYRDKGV